MVKLLWKSVVNELLVYSRECLTLSLPGVISHDFPFQSLTRDISYSMENLAFDSLLK